MAPKPDIHDGIVIFNMIDIEVSSLTCYLCIDE